MSLPRLLLALVAIATGACHTDTSAAKRSPDPGAAAIADTPSVSGDPPATPIARPGVGHASAIDRITISVTGKTVVTRDQQGGLRLWPDLQGEAEPLLVPGRSVDLASVAETDDGWTIATVDASGGAKVMAMDREGRSRDLATLPPFAPVLEALVLPSGRHSAVLHRDHSITILDGEGKVVAKFEERKFRPTTLRASADGKRLAVVVPTRKNAGDFAFEIQNLKIEGLDGPTPRIARDGTPTLVTSPVDLSPTTLAISTDLRRVATLSKNTEGTWDVVVKSVGGDEARTFETNLRAGSTPSIGFVTAHHLVMTSNDLATASLVDLESGTILGRNAPPSDFTHQGRVQAYGGGVQVAGFGTALFVHDVLERDHRFLSYQTLQANSASLSPSRKWVAWATMQGKVYVEAVGDGDPLAPTPTPMELHQVTDEFGMLWVRFVDDERLLAVQTNGQIVLHHWPSDTRLARSGVSGSIREVDFDPDRGLLLVTLHTNDMRVIEVSREGIVDGWVLTDQSFRGGLLRGRAEEGKRQPVVWTVDGQNRLRTYTLAELRSDLSREEAERKGKPLAAGQAAPLTVDGRGRHYGVRWDASKMALYVDAEGNALRTRRALGDNVSRIMVAPDGNSFLVVYDGTTSFVALHDAQTLKDRWTFSTGISPSDLAWSSDGTRIAVAAANGAVVLDASSGKVLRRRCGLAFGVSGGPPQSAFQTLGQRSICEL